MKTNESTNKVLNIVWPIALIALLTAVDQIIKAIVVKTLPYHQPVTAIEGLLNWTYTTNTGGGFSILAGKTFFLVASTAVLMGAMAWLYCKGWLQNIWGRLSVLLIIAGGIGNMIDRVFNDGHVVDFIDISPIFSFPIFNFADCCVTVGGILFCVYIAFMHKFSDEEKKQEEAEAVEEAETEETETVEAAEESAEDETI